VLGHARAAVPDVEDLAADAPRGLRSPEAPAAAAADSGCVGDDFIRLRDLPERAPRVAWLAAGLHAGLLPEASGATDLLPREVERRRQRGVV